MSEILCHCRVNPDGHEPGSVLDCEAPKIRQGQYPSRSGTCPDGTYARIGGVPITGEFLPTRTSDVRGTCPDCGRKAKVRRVEIRGVIGRRPRVSPCLYCHREVAVDDRGRLAKHPDRPGHTCTGSDDLVPYRRIRKTTRGPLLEVRPAIAEHKVKGKPCPGAGKLPAETRYTPGYQLAEWVRAYGDEAVA